MSYKIQCNPVDFVARFRGFYESGSPEAVCAFVEVLEDKRSAWLGVLPSMITGLAMGMGLITPVILKGYFINKIVQLPCDDDKKDLLVKQIEEQVPQTPVDTSGLSRYADELKNILGTYGIATDAETLLSFDRLIAEGSDSFVNSLSRLYRDLFAFQNRIADENGVTESPEKPVMESSSPVRDEEGRIHIHLIFRGPRSEPVESHFVFVPEDDAWSYEIVSIPTDDPESPLGAILGIIGSP